mmetsp:Transcript_50064/g.116960  ORF Transcript_50064/g.116960 Transcript_50064/m.116960 type:complete len:219 (+) Transcript_50064:111-767(+)
MQPLRSLLLYEELASREVVVEVAVCARTVTSASAMSDTTKSMSAETRPAFRAFVIAAVDDESVRTATIAVASPDISVTSISKEMVRAAPEDELLSVNLLVLIATPVMVTRSAVTSSKGAATASCSDWLTAPVVSLLYAAKKSPAEPVENSSSKLPSTTTGSIAATVVLKLVAAKLTVDVTVDVGDESVDSVVPDDDVDEAEEPELAELVVLDAVSKLL